MKMLLVGALGMLALQVLLLVGAYMLRVTPEVVNCDRGRQSVEVHVDKALRAYVTNLDSLRCEMGEQTATGICFSIRFGLWSVWSSPIRHRSGYGAQVGHKDSPAHPSIESFLTPIPATAQIFAALHDADAPFYSSPKPPCPLVPSLPLVLLALLTFLASFGQAYLLHPHLFC
jgi:hypothetical protein